MKSKNKIRVLFMATLITCALSCNDDFPNEEPDNYPPGEKPFIELDKEDIYRYQTNKEMILYSLIRYDHDENKYYLDATDNDIESLGITVEAYEDGKTRVEQMNQINIEHQ